jgi:phosphoserine phosphatase RsbU/P
VTTDVHPRLVVHDSLGHRAIPLDKPLLTIGRRPGHDVQLDSLEVSRDHAEIARTPDGYELRDLGSRYGTFVNGVRATTRVLTHGDRIECGRRGAVLVFLIEAAQTGTGAPGSTAVNDVRQVAALLESLRAMGGERVLDEVLALVLDSAIDATGAERGFIMLPNAQGRLEMTLARQVGGRTLSSTVFDTSRKIPEEVFSTGEMSVVVDLLEGDLPAVHSGTVAFGIRQVLCAPLRLVRYLEKGDAFPTPSSIGVLYLDSREKGRLLSAATRRTLEALAAEAATAIENARLYREALEKERLDRELLMASRIQQALMPEPRRIGRFFEAVGASVPSRAIGGDFFDYLDLADERIGIALGDVTGKGPAAALVTAVVQGILGAHAHTRITPSALIMLVNRVLLSRRIESKYATIFLGVLSPDGSFVYCNAAQNPPLLAGHGGMRRLETGGTLVGAFPETVFDEERLQLAPGDTLVLFSDGIPEAMSAAGEEFGETRVKAVIEPVLTESPDRILKTLIEAVRDFCCGAPQHDDLTAVVLRYEGTP